MNHYDRQIAKTVWMTAVLAFLISAPVFGQQASSTQVLTLQVFETNMVDISQRSLTLVINQASLQTGSPVEAVNEDGILEWVTNGENKKITVASNNATPRYQVKMQALDITGSTATAAPEVTLNDNTTKDLVVGVSKSWGKCKIRFSASAKVTDGVGTDSHVITYTITGG